MSSKTRARRLAKKNGVSTEAPAVTYKTIKEALASGASRDQIVGKRGNYSVEA